MNTNRNNIRHPLLSRLASFFQRHAAKAPTQHTPLQEMSAAQRSAFKSRLRRLSHACHSAYRSSGNLIIPELHEEDGGLWYVNSRRAEPGNITAAQVSRLTPEQVDVLMRVILMQMAQLERIGFVHGNLSPDSLALRCIKGLCTASVLGLESGHFTDEENDLPDPVVSAFSSPESLRRSLYPNRQSADAPNNCFSAGCLYYLFLTGRTLGSADNAASPAESIIRATPLYIDVSDPVRATLLHWMLHPLSTARPCAEDLLTAMEELPRLGNSSPASLAVDPTPVTDHHAPSQRLAADGSGRLALVRNLTHFWNPGNVSSRSSFLLSAQQKLHRHAIGRLKKLCEQSAVWSQAQPNIAPCKLYAEAPWPVVGAQLPEGRLLTLDRLKRCHSSVFLLDARMTEILFAVRELHDDGYILGMPSPALFCACANPDGAEVHLTDLSGAVSLEDFPPPEAFCPDSENLPYLSPELSQYILHTMPLPDDGMQEWIGPASDIFSLGLIYHLILTGRLPQLIHPEHMTYANAVCHAESPEQVIAPDPALDSKHRKLVMQMLRMDPYDRPTSCAEIIDRVLNFYTA